MSGEIELVSDGDGLAVVGDADAVDRFLLSEGLPDEGRELLGLRSGLRSGLRAGAAVAQAASAVSSGSGRWVKLTKESAAQIKKYGLTPTDTPGVSHAMVGKPGSIRAWVQFTTGRGARLTNPAALAGAAGIMAQLAMQQAMDEILDYLAAIDEKVDDVLRAQNDAVLARMIGVGLMLDEAVAIRDQRGRVDDITWSKIQAAPAAIADTQAYALRQLGGIADKLERHTRLGDIADAAGEAELRVQEWLAVLARTFQLQDAVAVLELDRVLDAAPDELNGHRLGLQQARQRRLELITEQTEHLMTRIDAAATTADRKVLTHPAKAPRIVRSRNRVSASISEFHRALGLEQDHAQADPRRWSEAARATGTKAVAAATDRAEIARRAGGELAGRARAVPSRLARQRARGGSDGDPP